MPRSSRHKSHKQKKDNSKGTRQHSDSEEDGKLKDRKSREEEAIVRVSRDLASSDKRKLASHSSDGNELLEEYSVSKRRKERATDDGRRSGSSLGDKQTKKGESSRIDSEKRSRSKVSIDLKSKSSRRNESLSERKEENVGLAVEIDETKRNISSSSSKVESKRKPIKEDVKDKELGAERDRKVHNVGREITINVKPVMEVASSGKSRKQGSKLGADVNDELSMKGEVENTERKMQDELRNPELEKELEKRTRRRGDSSTNEDKHRDGVRDASDRILSSRDDLTKNGRYKDDKYKGSYGEDLNRDHRNGDDRRRDDRSSKYYTGDRSDTKRSRDESNNVENRHKKSKPRSSDHDGSPHLENQDTSYKENRGKKRSSNNNEDHSDLIKSQSTIEQSSKVEKKSLNSGKLELLADRGRSHSRHADVDSIVSSSTQKSSPSPHARFTKDQYRHNSKQVELKYKDHVSEERGQPTSSRELTGVPGIPERAAEPQSMEKVRLMAKPTQKDGNNLAELSAEKPPISDAQASPMYLMERSHSSANIDHRYLNTTVRRSLDVEETGRRSSGSKDAMDYSTNEDRGSGEFPMEKRNVDELSQADGDTLSVSSSFNRPSQLPSSSTYLLRTPHPSRTGVDSPSILASSEEDSKGKSSDRYKRIGDSNGGRTHGTAWRGVPNWFSPITNGFIPFQHGPPPGGFHAMMQHFPASPLFGVRPSMELHPSGVPYHISDGDGYSGHGGPFGWRNPGDEICPPQLHGWDGSNGIFKDESHMHKRPDWDRNGHLMGGQGWERGTEMSKGRNSGVNSEFPATSHREDDQLAPADEVWARQPSQQPRNERSRPGSRAESIEIKRSTIIPPAKDPSEAPVQIIREKTPEPSKASNDSTARFCHAYLSMLDISVDLTHPELYKQFMNLLDTEGNSTDGDNVNKLLYLEESKEAKKSISKTTLSAPLFPSIMDSALQRAITLYKKQGEEMKAKHPTKSFPGSDHPVRVATTDGEEPEPVETSGGEEKKLKAVPTSVEWKPEKEPVPASCHEEVPTCDEEIGECGVPIFCEVEKVDESVPTLGEVKREEWVSSSNHLEEVEVEVEAVVMTTSNLEKLEEAVGDRSPLLLHASQSISNSPSNDENINMARDSKGIYSASASSSEEQKGFNDETMCGPVLDVADGSSKAYEALMPESIEFSSVNLSRIHISPESTH